MKYAVLVLCGLVIGFLLRDCQSPDTITKIETVIERDTVYQTIRDTVYRTQVKHVYQRDTLIRFNTDTVLVSVPLNQFSEVFDVQYGQATVSGEVAGELTKLRLSTDFNIPLVTETKTVTITKKPQGLFLTAGVNSNLKPFLGGTFIKDRYLVGLTTESITLGYKIQSRR
jgi:hypothetical protein